MENVPSFFHWQGLIRDKMAIELRVAKYGLILILLIFVFISAATCVFSEPARDDSAVISETNPDSIITLTKNADSDIAIPGLKRFIIALPNILKAE